MRDAKREYNRHCDATWKLQLEKRAGCQQRICRQGRLPRGGSPELRPEGGTGRWVVGKVEGEVSLP